MCVLMIVVISLYAELKSMHYCQFSISLGVAQFYANQANNI